MRSDRFYNFVLFFFTTLMCFLISEITLRAVNLDNPLDSRNFAIDDIPNQVRSNMAINYDPVVGYVLRPNVAFGGSIEFENQKLSEYNSNKWGMRVSPNERRGLREGLPPANTGILVTGDSFAFGSEVADHETWQAYLEEITGIPFMNYGAGGFGFDQALLLMEKVIEEVKPNALMMSCIPNCIQRTELSFHGGLVKPYFLVDNQGNLTLHNNPVPTEYDLVKSYGGEIKWTQKVLGHSYAIFWVFKQLNKLDKWNVKAKPYIEEHKQGPEVTCALMKRYGSLAKEYSVPAFLIMEYSGLQAVPSEYSKWHSPARDSFRVGLVNSCARESGIIVIDMIETLHEIYFDNKNSYVNKFWDLWARQTFDKGEVNSGHMSAEGNKLVAQIVAKAISRYTPSLLNKKNMLPN